MLQRRVVPKMADISVPGYQAFWTDKRKRLKSEYKRQIGQFPNTDTAETAVYSILRYQGRGRVHSIFVGDNKQWSSIVSVAEENRQTYCNALTGQILFNAFYDMYSQSKGLKGHAEGEHRSRLV